MKQLLKILLFIAVIFPFPIWAISLEECQQMARENYPLLKQYGIIYEISDAEANIAAKNYLPQISVFVQATWQNHVTTFPETVKQLYSTMGIDMAGLSKDQYNIGVEASQLIWDGGLTKNEMRAAKATKAVSEAANKVEIYRVVNSVNELYFGILLCQSQIALNDELQNVIADNLSVIEANFNNGVAMESDVATVKAQLREAERSRISLEQMFVSNRRMLEIYVGKDLENETFQLPIVEGLFPITVNNRPENRFYEARRNLLSIQKDAINSSIMPQFHLFARGYYGNPGLDMFHAMFYDRWSFNFLAGVRLQWSVGELYRKKNRIRKIEATNSSIDIEQEMFQFNTELLTKQQQCDIESKRQQIIADDEIVSLRESIRLASEAKLRDGTILPNDLLRDIMNENNARIAKNIHEIELLHSIYKLKYILNR